MSTESKPAMNGRVRRLGNARLPTRIGIFDAVAFSDSRTGTEPIALIHGDVAGRDTPLVRLHSECWTGDVLGSLRCDCGQQLSTALTAIVAEGAGVLLYLRQEGRGIGLPNKLRAYALQDTGMDTVTANTALGLPVDAREYGAAAAILSDLGLERVRLMTNNPAKAAALEAYGIRVGERVPLPALPNPVNRLYLDDRRASRYADWRFPVDQRARVARAGTLVARVARGSARRRGHRGGRRSAAYCPARRRSLADPGRPRQ